MIFRYIETFRPYMAQALFSEFFKCRASRTSSVISEYTPEKITQEKGNSQPCFTPVYAAAITHCNHYHNICNRKRCNGTLDSFRTARNHRKKILENAECTYAQAALAKVVSKRLGPMNSGNQILKRQSVSTYIIKGPEVISSSSNKTKVFVKDFAFNSTLEDKGHPLQDFIPLHRYKHRYSSITV